MNILFMLGNGFDLNLGLKTSYGNFYTYYESKNSKSKKVNQLKNHIKNNYQNWSDLELALGQYTIDISSLEEFDEIFEDIGSELAQYLYEEEKRLDVNYENTNKDKLFKDLLYPEQSLTPVDANQLSRYKKKWQNHSWNTNIVTFNYTKSLEKLLNYPDKRIELGESNRYLQKIHHVHGYHDNSMIMGVNDVSQIKNDLFHDNLDVIEALIKPKCNEACGHTIDNQCEGLIQSAHLICIFGSSLGDTDKLWWDLIAKKLVKDDFKLIIFEWVDNLPPDRLEHKKARIRRDKKKNFLNSHP